jgi:hypothetical protein
VAGDWIKMRTDLATDPAVADMASSLGVEEDMIVGKLHRFWSWLSAHFAEARLKPDSASSRAWIDKYVALQGFTEALLAVGWMTIDDGYLSIPRYDRHMSENAKRRALRSEQQRSRRGSKSEAVLKPRIGVKQASREEKRREENKGNNPLPPSSRFVPPTLEEVTAYCAERGNRVDPVQFLNYYDSNGWRVGRNPMKNWRATVCTWERNEFANGTSRGHSKPATREQQRLDANAEAIAGFLADSGDQQHAVRQSDDGTRRLEAHGRPHEAAG